MRATMKDARRGPAGSGAAVFPRTSAGFFFAVFTTRDSALEQIAQAAKDRSAPFLIYQEGDAVTRALRDYLTDDIGEILIDDPARPSEENVLKLLLAPRTEKTIETLVFSAWTRTVQATG